MGDLVNHQCFLAKESFPVALCQVYRFSSQSILKNQSFSNTFTICSFCSSFTAVHPG